MGLFREWMSPGVFSRTPEQRSFILYSEDMDEYFWVVHAKNWEHIHREAMWYAITLEDQEKALEILNGTTMREISLTDNELMEEIRKARPDMDNSNPNTKGYNTLDSALFELASGF